MKKKPKVLVIASSGGHWTQLLRLLPAMEDCEMVFVSTHEGYRSQVNGHTFHAVADATRWEKLKLLKMAQQVRKIMASENPDFVLSTGAAPGLMAILWGWLRRKKTIWIDSIANVDRISMSGRIAKPFSTLHLTQWEHLADGKTTFYKGTVIS